MIDGKQVLDCTPLGSGRRQNRILVAQDRRIVKVEG